MYFVSQMCAWLFLSVIISHIGQKLYVCDNLDCSRFCCQRSVSECYCNSYMWIQHVVFTVQCHSLSWLWLSCC